MIEILLEPIEHKRFAINASDTSLATIIDAHQGEKLSGLSAYKVAILGITETRHAENDESYFASDRIRAELYKLENHFSKDFRIIDLGNIKLAETFEETQAMITQVTEYVLKRQVILLVLGSHHDAAYPIYCGYKNLDEMINMVVIDSKLDLERRNEILEDTCHPDNQLLKIISHQPSHLLNITSLGYQTYFTSREQVQLMEDLYFDNIRLGEAITNIEHLEPVMRSAQCVFLDVTSIRNSDAPGTNESSPNGFFGHEMCQIAKYAGINDILSCFGIFEYNPTRDRGGITAKLLAQVIWYLFEGIDERMNDTPKKDSKNYIRYTTTLNEGAYNIAFYKSKKSGRWWIEIPLPTPPNSNIQPTFLMPCTYDDYKTSTNDEVPDIWWKYVQKFTV
jgi:arginase family enzyme